MLHILKYLKKQLEFHREFADAIKLIDSNNKIQALNKFESMLVEYPTNAYVRNHVIFLGKELHKPVNIPEVHNKNKSK